MKLSQDEINRGISIQIRPQRNARTENDVNRFQRTEYVNQRLLNLRKGRARRIALMKRRRLANKQQSKLLKTLASPIKNVTENAMNLAMNTVPKTVFMRSKRSLSKDLTGRKELQVEDLRKFIESDDSDEDAFTDGYNSNEQMKRSLLRSQPIGRKPQQNMYMKYINSVDNGEYAYDNNDDDLYNENDEILRQHSHRGADGTYIDLIKKIRSAAEPENRAIKTINYGRGHTSSSLPNDYVGADDDAYDEQPIYDDDENYYDY